MGTDQITIIHHYLTFKIDNELFAVNVNKILSILELTKITKIPRSPDYVKGVINFQGTVLPIVDIRLKFDIHTTDLSPGACILVFIIEIEGKSVKIGALVDTVEEVIELENKDILPPPRLGSNYHADFIEGLYKTDSSIIMLLNIEVLFSEDELTVLSYSEMVLDEKGQKELQEEVKE